MFVFSNSYSDAFLRDGGWWGGVLRLRMDVNMEYEYE